MASVAPLLHCRFPPPRLMSSLPRRLMSSLPRRQIPSPSGPDEKSVKPLPNGAQPPQGKLANNVQPRRM
ncbi:hypothetical protein OROHE_010656 [Orobanche hederae]